ncbi:MAG: diphthine--ammonia ligase [Dehalococcoidia bacterium]|nr:diphthine--ammonia ligase [Dehalococcoidia bacterium]
MKVVCSWSGGKDSCLACYKAKQQGHEVQYLVNFLREDGKRSLGHLLDVNIIDLQSHLAGIPLLRRNVTWGTYEAQYSSVMGEAKHKGARGSVFGDIDLRAHRDWLETVCQMAAVEPIFPLWEMDRRAIMDEFLGAGFEGVVVATKGSIMGPEWLGRNLNEQFIKDIEELQKTVSVDLCGEGGEYHSLVTAGPLFSQRIKVTLAQPVLRDDHWFADIMGYGIE